jgi:hypothetical protein
MPLYTQLISASDNQAVYTGLPLKTEFFSDEPRSDLDEKELQGLHWDPNNG